MVRSFVRSERSFRRWCSLSKSSRILHLEFYKSKCFSDCSFSVTPPLTITFGPSKKLNGCQLSQETRLMAFRHERKKDRIELFEAVSAKVRRGGYRIKILLLGIYRPIRPLYKSRWILYFSFSHFFAIPFSLCLLQDVHISSLLSILSHLTRVRE